MNNLTVVLRLYNEQYNDSPLGEWGTLSLDNCVWICLGKKQIHSWFQPVSQMENK